MQTFWIIDTLNKTIFKNDERIDMKVKLYPNNETIFSISMPFVAIKKPAFCL